MFLEITEVVKPQLNKYGDLLIAVKSRFHICRLKQICGKVLVGFISVK